jgi:endonuclease-3 related protein
VFPLIENRLRSIYQILFAHFGHRRWWPARTPFEVCVGAILTQNTSWKNVVKAISNLDEADRLDALRLYEIREEDLATIIRPAGYYNIKAKRLKNFITHVVEKHDGSLDKMFLASVDDLRKELLSINGVGRETADSMILYAAGKPIFVIDVYTRRVLRRHGILGAEADYDEAQSVFHRNIEPDVALYNDFHAQFVAVGSNYCGTKPKCSGCPLEGM